jgi:hypothetical protein
MRMISPQIDAPQIQVAEDSDQFMVVTAALVTNPQYELATGRRYNTIMMAWRPSALERAKLANGEDLYIGVLTFGGPLQALIPIVGKHEAAEVFRVGVTV